MPIKKNQWKQTNKQKIHVIPTRTQRNRWRIVCLDWQCEVIRAKFERVSIAKIRRETRRETSLKCPQRFLLYWMSINYIRIVFQIQLKLSTIHRGCSTLKRKKYLVNCILLLNGKARKCQKIVYLCTALLWPTLRETLTRSEILQETFCSHLIIKLSSSFIFCRDVPPPPLGSTTGAD